MNDVDFIFNGQATGDLASKFLEANMDPGALRPFEEDGRCWITLAAGTKNEKTIQVANTSTLRKDEWILLDTEVMKVAKDRLKLWGDLMGAGLKYTIPNGMSVTVLQHQTMSDISEAVTSMDGLRRSDVDRPVFDLSSMPLPIIHKDGGFSLREIMTGRRSGTPIDTATISAATIRVTETVERYIAGTNPVYTYANGSIYGYLNYPNRISYVMTNPTSGGWSPQVALTEFLEMKKASQDAKHYGPWKVYVSNDWDTYMDDDFNVNYPGLTLRERIGKINGFTQPETADYLGDGFHAVIVQMQSTVVEGVEGMAMTTLRWTEQGGMDTRFKVACIMVPRLRKDFNGNTGLVHGQAA